MEQQKMIMCICPHCNNELNVAEEFNEKEITCPLCLNRFPNVGIKMPAATQRLKSWKPAEPSPKLTPQPEQRHKKHKTINTKNGGDTKFNIWDVLLGIAAVLLFPVIAIFAFAFDDGTREKYGWLGWPIIAIMLVCFICFGDGCEPPVNKEAIREEAIRGEAIRGEAIERTKHDLYIKGLQVFSSSRSMTLANSLSNIKVDIYHIKETGDWSVFVYGNVTEFGKKHNIRWCYLVTKDGEWVTVSTYMGPE